MRLIVGYQATPSGADGIALAVTLARSLEAELDIALVLPQDRPVPSKAPVESGYDDILITRAEGWLEDALDLVPHDVVARAHLRFDESFAQGLLDAATEYDAYMIVVGAAGDGLLGRHSLGTVTTDLLHVAHLPLALAPRGYRHDPPAHVREITCAIGNRPGASALAAAATDLSARTAGALRLVSLISIDSALAGEPTATLGARRRDTAKAEANLTAALADLPEGIPVQSLVAEGSGVESAVGSLEWHSGDVVMVGSSRLGQPRRLFLGSTAAKMLRVVPVPMIVVPKEADHD